MNTSNKLAELARDDFKNGLKFKNVHTTKLIFQDVTLCMKDLRQQVKWLFHLRFEITINIITLNIYLKHFNFYNKLY